MHVQVQSRQTMYRAPCGARRAGLFVRSVLMAGVTLIAASFSAANANPGTACQDKRCDGDVVPAHDALKEVALKAGGRWFVGPREYFGAGINGGSFEWWDHRALAASAPRPSAAQVLAKAGRGYDFSVELFLRSNAIPPEPRGYRLIQWADQRYAIASRQKLRPGLEMVRLKHVLGPHGYSIDHVTYYVATELRGPDGLPPVAACNHDHPTNSGGTGFIWRPGIWVGARWNQAHCNDWPELYVEIERVLAMLREK